MAQCLAHAKAQSGGNNCADHGVPNTDGSEVIVVQKKEELEVNR